jgi:hypothetical protein
MSGSCTTFPQSWSLPAVAGPFPPRRQASGSDHGWVALIYVYVFIPFILSFRCSVCVHHPQQRLSDLAPRHCPPPSGPRRRFSSWLRPTISSRDVAASEVSFSGTKASHNNRFGKAWATNALIKLNAERKPRLHRCLDHCAAAQRQKCSGLSIKTTTNLKTRHIYRLMR